VVRWGDVLVVLKAHNLLDVLDLLILHDLVVLCLTHIEKLATQWEDAKVIMSDNTTSHSECL
jgi:hypothetical protein